MKIIVEHHHYWHGAESDLMNNIFTFTKLIHQQNNKIMADIQAFETALNRIDTATTNIANQLRDLKDKLANQGLPADVENTVLARLESAATQLEAVGQSVENPVPEPGPAPEGGGGNDNAGSTL